MTPAGEGLVAIGAYLPAILAELTRTPLVRRVDGGFDILDSSLPDFVYELDDEVLRDASSAMFWIRQLGEKSWVTKQHLIDLAKAVISHLESEGRTP